MSAGSTTTTTARRATDTSRNTLIVRIIIGLAVLGGFSLVSFMAIRWFGTVEGVEFSPDTFAQRHFQYLEVPLLRARISTVYHEDVSGPLAVRVRDNPKLFPPPEVDPPRWHLVAMQRGSRSYTDDAQIVCRYLDAEGDTALRWLRWNREHEALAAILWPAVIEACRGEHYTFTPELFATAERLATDASMKPSEADFREAIGQSMARQYVRLADAEQGLERHDVAVKLYTAALTHQANNPAALRGRALSYAALGESAKANADRDAAKRLHSSDK